VAEWTQSIELEGGVQIFQILPIEDGFYLIGKTSTDIKFPTEKDDILKGFSFLFFIFFFFFLF